ncbi:MAG: 50S ribosomal protein L9 [Candidatus Dormibacteria bacterium]
MKVILLRDIKGLGAAGDVKEVAEGYGRNFLLPRKMAIVAQKGQLAEAEKVKAAKSRRDEKAREEALALRDRIASLQVILKVRVGEEGKMFGAITNNDVAEALQEQHAIEIDKRKVSIPDAVKSTGEWTASLELDHGIDAELRLIVTEL